MQIDMNVERHLKSTPMEDNGAVECLVEFEEFGTKNLIEIPFRLDCGADKTLTSLFSLMYKLGYTSEYIKENMGSIAGQSMGYADKREVKAYFVKMPYIAFLDSYFTGENNTGFPIYVDCPQDSMGNILYDKIDEIYDTIISYKNSLRLGNITDKQIDAIEELARNSADNLLGLDIKYKYLWIHDPTQWQVDAYSITQPAKEICSENKIIKHSSLNITEIC